MESTATPVAASFLPLVAHVVRQLSARYPRHVDRAAMWSLGAWGLVAATERHDPTGPGFPRAALHLVRSTIVDATRVGAPAARVTEDDDAVLAERLGLQPSQLRVLRDAAIPVPVLPSVPDTGPSRVAERRPTPHWVTHTAAAMAPVSAPAPAVARAI